MPFGVNRPIIAQPFESFGLSVPAPPTAPVPIDANSRKEDLIDTFLITVPAAAANSIFMGTSGVGVGQGLELLQGTTVMFKIDHDGRQVYELQGALVEIATALECRVISPDAIPFVVWDLTQICLIAVAATAITVAVMRNPYV